MDNVTITESRPSEVLASLHEAADPEREYLFAARDAQQDDLILVAWNGDEAVGYIAATDQRSDGLLLWEHIVAPAHRGKGFGQRLLLEAVRRTVPGAVVEVDPLAELDLDRIADYYRGLGFSRDAAKGGLWATASDVIRAAARRSGSGPETETPVSAIVDAKTPGVVTVSPDCTVREAVSKLNEHHIGAVVLSSDGSRIEGILSERDVLIALDEVGADVLEQPVGEIGTTDVLTCTSYDTIATLMETMTNRRVRHMPVTSTGRLIGIVSVGDVVSYRLRDVSGST